MNFIFCKLQKPQTKNMNFNFTKLKKLQKHEFHFLQAQKTQKKGECVSTFFWNVSFDEFVTFECVTFTQSVKKKNL